MANPAMQRDFIDGHDNKTPLRKGRKQTATRKDQKKKRRKPVRTESVKQLERTAFLHGIKAERLHQQKWRPRPVGATPGTYFCEGGCGATWESFEDAWKALDVSHEEPRNDTSTRYERRREPDFRGDDPKNILIECRACNQGREPNPEWSGAS